MVKYSQFNSILFYEQNKYALFNTMTQRVIFLVPELKELLQAGINEGIENLKSYHPSFFEYLVKKEFIVDNDINEVEKVQELSRSVDNNEEEFILIINPTMNCNFKCWYCYETHIKKSRLDDANLTRINKFIDKVSNDAKIKQFSLSLFGGEPLLYFERTVIPIVDHFIEKCSDKGISYDVSFTTNGYLIDQAFIDYFNRKGVKCNLQITLDGHREDHDTVRYVNEKKGSYDKIVENIHLLVQNHFPVRVRINYTDKNIHSSGKIIEDFSGLSKELKDMYLAFDFHRVWQNADGENVETELKAVMGSLRENSFFTQTNATINSVVNSCYADKKNSVTINYNGDIFKCTARDFKTENRMGFLDDNGNLVWENNSLENRMNIKFQNKPCLSCRLLPVCNGGCSQAAVENLGQDYCVYNGDDSEKDRVIRGHIDNIVHFQTLEKSMQNQESVSKSKSVIIPY